MKRFLTLLLCVLLAVAMTFSFVACEDVEKPNTDPTNPSNPSTPVDPDNPNPNNPNPGNPNNPNPGNPDNPNPGNPNPGNPDNPNPGTPDNPNPDTPNPDTPNPDDRLKAQLLDSMIAESMGEMPGFEMLLTATYDGSQEVEIAARGTRNPSTGLNVDMAAVVTAHDMTSEDIEYCVTCVIVRNNNLFTTEDPLCLETAPNGDLFALGKEYMDENPYNFQLPDRDSMIGDGHFSLSDIFVMMTGDQDSRLQLNDNAKMLFKNLFDVVYNKVETTENGYAVSIDLEKLFETLWNKLYAVAAAIDVNPQMTVKQLYADKSVQDLVAPLLKDVSGKQLKAMLDMLVKASEIELPFELPAAADESAVDYIAKVLDSLMLDVDNSGTEVAFSSLKISQIYALDKGDPTAVMPDLTDTMDGAKTDLFAQMKAVSEGFDFEVNFNSAKVMTGMKMNMKQTIPDADGSVLEIIYDMDYTVLTAAPKLWDTTGYACTETSVEVAQTTVNACSDNFFFYSEYDADIGKIEHVFFTISDNDLKTNAWINAYDDIKVSVVYEADDIRNYGRIEFAFDETGVKNNSGYWPAYERDTEEKYNCTVVNDGNGVETYTITYTIQNAQGETLFELLISVKKITTITEVR